ncbi:sugar/nucleoside kinase (ribokinase family) [Thermosporothrix hazakensis]|jgi:sugar/nucleoside kinase (ribokinase family)|uniref:Sugar/nucleoside kinase (Ribokinase family) n=2 Tax=Thermosporothrix TaxID=768650 RepID=A0A326UCF6_THEHA|nr:PfkB family carbohydrate kinase [Thermosporothrix hazakensis]PZW22969.1 sugar/nucleoside kinase (ribokinase family) [Thermosporothrix hazakensis]BBH90061.1 ribokinase [Thermosporothrix sp. COM3]GCE48282.1 ribokinase [Thermosporothrix hazakensis]
MLPVPDFLTIGHVSKDLRPDGTYTLGGTVTYAALTAQHLGLATGVITCADPNMCIELPSHLPGIALHIRPSSVTTTFINQYTEGVRIQYLCARADTFEARDVPEAWRNTPIVLLGPLAQELPTDFASLFPRRPDALIAASPQGWLRQWDADGRIWPTAWHDAPKVLSSLDVLILSYEDILSSNGNSREEADALFSEWSTMVPILVATEGRYGATLFHEGQTKQFPAYEAEEVDPTGAGDVFAAAFLIHLSKNGDPELAVEYANCVASFSVQQEGTKGIPSLSMINRAFRSQSRKE